MAYVVCLIKCVPPFWLNKASWIYQLFLTLRSSDGSHQKFVAFIGYLRLHLSIDEVGQELQAENPQLLVALREQQPHLHNSS